MEASRTFFMRFKYAILAATLTGLIAGLAYCMLRPQDYVGTTRLFFSTGAVDVSAMSVSGDRGRRLLRRLRLPPEMTRGGAPCRP